MPTPIVKLDGSTIYVEEDFHTGKQYVDAPTRLDWIEKHFCRFEDYGLANDMFRCRKCGLVREGSDLDKSWDGKNYKDARGN